MERERAGAPGASRISVIVPTLNEAANIDPLLKSILDTAERARLDLEVIVVDDGSGDGTRERVRAWEGRHPVRLVARDGERGLAGAVLRGAKEAAGDVVVVMDADLSHPADRIPDLVAHIASGASDMVIGSRYVAGGGSPGWPLRRRIASRGAAALAWLLTDVRDPLSGFFAVRRERLMLASGHSKGFKIGLEVLARGGELLRVSETPITFRDRTQGKSKLGAGVIFSYLRRLWTLHGGSWPQATAFSFAAGVLLGLAADLAAFQALLASGVSPASAHLASFGIGLLFSLLPGAGRIATTLGAWGAGRSLRATLTLLAVSLLAVFLRGAVLAACLRAGWPAGVAILPALAAGGLAAISGFSFFVFPRGESGDGALRLRALAVWVLVYGLLLRLAYLGLADLIPEEAYYWNYSQHLDIGYLDHPPMVAWLIWLGSLLFGNSELAVRLGALVSWAAAACFSFLLARDLFGKSAGLGAALLLGSLPFFFSTGFLMTPDAPLLAAWAGGLYFLARALLRGEGRAFVGAGVCVGLGLLSKYTIALLGLSTLVFMLVHAPSRRRLVSPGPYLAVIIAGLLFLPVVVWNAQHEWASFSFQGTRRLAEPSQFKLGELLSYVLLLLTPVGLLAVGLALFTAPPGRPSQVAPPGARLFLIVHTLCPLAVFVSFSLFHPTKMSWTGPAWLAALPLVGLPLMSGGGAPAARGAALMRWLWAPTIGLLLIGYGACSHYLVLGLPGVPYTARVTLLMNWREMGRQVAELGKEVQRRTGEQPIVVGLDKYQIASEMAFYAPELGGARGSTGRHLFGLDGLMYEYWFPRDSLRGRTLLLIATHPRYLTGERIESYAATADPVETLEVRRRGMVVGRYYSRVLHGYRSGPVALKL